jgi:hypothetical protein
LGDNGLNGRLGIANHAVEQAVHLHAGQTALQQIGDAARIGAGHEDQHPLPRLHQGGHAVLKKVSSQLQIGISEIETFGLGGGAGG